MTMIELDKIVYAPTIAVVAKTVMIVDGVFDAIEDMGAEEAAEKQGTPLNNLTARISESGTEYGGNGDDLAEFAGRQCYRSWSVGRDNAEYIENVIEQGHGSIFQHAQISMQITGVSRSLTHELVRHGTGTGFSQESQRYVDAKDIRFVMPPLLAEYADHMNAFEFENDPEVILFRTSSQTSLNDYIEAQAMFVQRQKNEAEVSNGDDTVRLATSLKKRANEAARCYLPNATETRLVFTGNLRMLLYFLALRGTEYADLEIRRLAVAMLEALRPHSPNFFSNLSIGTGEDGLPIVIAKVSKV